ncbi:glycosyltransferase [Limosilactobacillus fermentum]|nr:glycosyltransferase [Limosilactobacillus fermentum]
MIYTQEEYPLECKANIAILMATYNGESFIEDQLKSILKQSYKNWELFIHDDGSTDGTKDIIKMYACQYPSKIHVLTGKINGNAKENFFI